MKEADVRPNVLEMAHQIVWLMNEFPGKTINDFVTTFLVPEMPIFHVNLAIWTARDLGYIVIEDENFDGSGTYKVDRVPDVWHFGEKVNTLLESVPYFIGCLNSEESDISEGQLQSWFSPAYTRYEYGIALKQLINNREIATYTLAVVNRKEPSKKGAKRGKTTKITEDKYIYYTLWQNLEQQWGKKQHPDQSRVE